nr:MAG TPA: hypothetical protein [Caudoviricetes sp.]
MTSGVPSFLVRVSVLVVTLRVPGAAVVFPSPRVVVGVVRRCVP